MDPDKATTDLDDPEGPMPPDADPYASTIGPLVATGALAAAAVAALVLAVWWLV